MEQPERGGQVKCQGESRPELVVAAPEEECLLKNPETATRMAVAMGMKEVGEDDWDQERP